MAKLEIYIGTKTGDLERRYGALWLFFGGFSPKTLGFGAQSG